MTALVKLEDGHVSFKCPGCRLHHTLPVQGAGTTWQFNGDVESPTLSPSILARGGCCYEPDWHEQEWRRHPGPEHWDKHHPDEDGASMCHVCHSFVKERANRVPERLYTRVGGDDGAADPGRAIKFHEMVSRK